MHTTTAKQTEWLKKNGLAIDSLDSRNLTIRPVGVCRGDWEQRYYFVRQWEGETEARVYQTYISNVCGDIAPAAREVGEPHSTLKAALAALIQLGTEIH